ncbi:hypothetical protein MKX01_019224 [Papaver californicum]|nr:hypothetical protein MKX01_019224 [Papaver californicum]
MDYDLCGNNGNSVFHPPGTRNRVRRVSRATGNGTSGSARYPKFFNDMENQIHRHEQDAYISVLWAFKVQSDALSWDKERLMADLRIELRVSDEEHREFLKKVYVDDDNCSTFRKKQKISLTFGNWGVAGHAFRDISSIESAQYYSTGPTGRGICRGVRRVKKQKQ